jgi:hypothetical protein
MERSDPVTVIIARIMRMMERSSESLINSISSFEGSDTMGEALPLPRQTLRRRRDAQPNRNLMRRKPRDLEQDSFAPMAHDHSPPHKTKTSGWKAS